MSHPISANRWRALKAQSEASYAVRVDLRELSALCEAALQLTWLREAVREATQYLTIEDEKARFLDLVAKITAHIEGGIS